MIQAGQTADANVVRTAMCRVVDAADERPRKNAAASLSFPWASRISSAPAAHLCRGFRLEAHRRMPRSVFYQMNGLMLGNGWRLRLRPISCASLRAAHGRFSRAHVARRATCSRSWPHWRNTGQHSYVPCRGRGRPTTDITGARSIAEQACRPDVGPAGGHRQQGRRQRHAGGRSGGARPSPTAHAVCHLGHDAGGQSRALRQAALRSGRADFAPITRFGTSPFVLLVMPIARSRSLADLTALLKRRAGQAQFRRRRRCRRASPPSSIVSSRRSRRRLRRLQEQPAGFPRPSGRPAHLHGDRHHQRQDCRSTAAPAAALPLTLPRARSRACPHIPSAAEAGLPDVPDLDLDRLLRPQGHAEGVGRQDSIADIVAPAGHPEVLARLDAMGSTPSTLYAGRVRRLHPRRESSAGASIIRRGNIRLE